MNKKKCKELEMKLYAYADDGLNEEDKALVEEHISVCPECKKSLDEIYELAELVNSLPEIELSEEYKQELFDKAWTRIEAKEKAKLRRKKLIARTTASTLAVAACAAMAFGVYSGGVYDKLNKADEMIEVSYTDGDEITQTDSTDNKVKSEVEPTQKDETFDKAEVNDNRANTSEKVSGNTTENANESLSVQNNTKKSKTSGNEKTVNEPKRSGNNGTVSENNTAESTATEPVKTADREDIKVKQENEVPEVQSVQSANEEVHAGGGMMSRSSSSVISREADRPAAVCADEAEGIAVYSDEETASGRAVEVPTACEVVCDDPSGFAEHFGENKTGEVIEFSVSDSEWTELKSYAETCGAQLDAEFGEDSDGQIDVTVREKQNSRGTERSIK